MQKKKIWWAMATTALAIFVGLATFSCKNPNKETNKKEMKEFPETKEQPSLSRI
ncbi:hypothetical protein OF375_00740 [Ureaplasma miroungigenitalium]|uniref:hypothetical protein n=1 Tax=Ureaplasma miroungigenitalium TaxID=1042321 RepID=UPI0021E98B7F|nr:hypothetical protein [Ureaplasma miroungigenitalium]MCV3734119.1 hypothetical protein [Ureaplasma miroungigenitalium]